jgi:hypothetical protein
VKTFAIQPLIHPPILPNRSQNPETSVALKSQQTLFSLENVGDSELPLFALQNRALPNRFILDNGLSAWPTGDS